jgi:hypothetical protein
MRRIRALPETHVQAEVMDMKAWQIGGGLLVAASMLACSGGGPVSLGNNAAKTGETLSDYGASWDGYIEATMLASGSDRIRLQLDETGNGWLQLGDIPLVDPPTDPNAPYPNDPNYPQFFPFGEPDDFVHEGFRYTVKNAVVEEKRIRISIASYEFYNQWCELQTSYPNSDPNGSPAYACAPPSSTGFQSNGNCYIGTPVIDPSLPHGTNAVPGPNSTEVNCTQFNYCEGPVGKTPCTCSADGCVSTDNTVLTLDAALDNNGEDLTGTLVDSYDYTVRLSRQ